MIVLFILVFMQDFQLQQLERRISRMQGERSNEEKLQLEARITVKLHKSFNPLEFCCFSKVAYTCRLLCIENSIHCRCSHFAVDFVGSFFKWCYPKPNYFWFWDSCCCHITRWNLIVQVKGVLWRTLGNHWPLPTILLGTPFNHTTKFHRGMYCKSWLQTIFFYTQCPRLFFLLGTDLTTRWT